MLKYLMKNLPAKYIYAGYCIRKGFTIMTSQENGKIVYDTFLFTYVDNFLSFFLKMDNGKYKSVDYNIEVSEATAEDLVSRHLTRGILKDTEEFEQYDKEQIIGVFGVRDISVLMKQVDTLKKNDPDSFDVSLEAWLDVKPSYMGMEVVGVINTFNKCLKYDKGRITVPPIKNGPEDNYVSLIGDEMDYFDFMSEKDSDEIVRDLKALDDKLDGVGNLKREVKRVDVKKEEEVQEEYDDIIDTL